jgi:RNA polymerase sigma-70 factor (ECF subfamily)
MTPSSDPESLARRLARREPAALREFCASFGPRIYKYLKKRGLPDADAGDLAGTLATDIALKADKYRFVGSFTGWVFRIVHNAFCDWERQNRAPMVPFDESIPAPELHGREYASNPAADEVVQLAVGRLSTLERDILQMRYHGIADSFEEIGRYLGIKPGTIRTRHQRALKKLAKMIENNPAIEARKNSSLRRIEVTEDEK